MNDSKKNSKPKDNKKFIKCKNCRREIAAEKMFLHEGFCQRNNIFCDHCQKVFLKDDYEKHLKTSINKAIRYLKTPERPRRAEKEAKIKTINIYTSPIITKRKTTFEYIEMPMTEQYKVNNPIIISENGQILSNESNNEYLLPYFGINSPKSFERNNIIEEDKIINQGEFLGENAPVLFNENEKEVNQYIENNLRNSLNTKNINNNYNEMNEVNKMEIINDELNPKINVIDLTENSNFINKKNIFNRSNSSGILLNNINLKENDMKQKNNNINFNFMQSNSDSKQIKVDNKPKNNNIIINNNIITYNSNNNINKIHNFYNTEDNNQNSNGKSLMNNNIFENFISTKFNSTRTSKKNEIIKFKKNLAINIKKNELKKNTKEPNDSGDKKSPRNNKITSYLLERSPKNTKQKKSNQKNQAKTEIKIKNAKKICEFCGSETDDLAKHYKIYHFKLDKNTIKPQKRDTVLLNEKLNSGNTDETGIEESNKIILLRQLKPSFNLIANDNTNKFNTSGKKNGNFPKFKSPERMRKINKINLNNIEINEKSKKKMFPEDNLRGSLLAKTQAREYDRERKIYLGDNFIENENRSTLKGITFFPSGNYGDEFAFNKNENIKPIQLFSEGKKTGNYDKKKMVRSPVVKKINFLKTILDDDFNY